MVDNLLAHRKLIGNSRQEILELLGEPEHTGYFKEYDMVYWLGPERSFISIDSESLVLKLDQAGRVSEYCILTD